MKYRMTIECLDNGVVVDREVSEALDHPFVIRSMFEALFPQLLDFFIDQLKDSLHEL